MALVTPKMETEESSGFLYNMIRILAGTLIEIGRGALAPEQMKDIYGQIGAPLR